MFYKEKPIEKSPRWTIGHATYSKLNLSNEALILENVYEGNVLINIHSWKHQSNAFNLFINVVNALGEFKTNSCRQIFKEILVTVAER